MQTTPRVLWETSGLLAIDKPAGLNVERWPGFPSVEDWAADYLGAGRRAVFVGIIHRLDRPVSGVLLLAKKKSALLALNEQFRQREVAKSYQALVERPLPEASGELMHWLRKDQVAKRAYAYDAPAPQAQEARIRYRQLEVTPWGVALEIRPDAGKYHQIRVQLAAAGSPIVGDMLYGAQSAFAPDAIALHAASITFFDPAGGQEVTVAAPPPWHAPALPMPHG
jgi:23S rRNA pseudouridine1911/1915/1917 synthase